MTPRRWFGAALAAVGFVGLAALCVSGLSQVPVDGEPTSITEEKP